MFNVEKILNYDTVIVGCGAAGLFSALHLPASQSVLMICKEGIEICDSMLAQGGICVLKDEADFTSYYEDTMRAGHYENNPESVSLMIRNSPMIIEELLAYGVRFEKNQQGELRYTKEGGHSKPRICFHQDKTGEEITTVLRNKVLEQPNITILENTVMTDFMAEQGICKGIVADKEEDTFFIYADDVILATGGIGGLYKHSTNYASLTGDALRICKKYGVRLDHLDYVQIHPTTLYSKQKGRSFLISESARGEGAILLNSKNERFVNELLPRDVVSKAIFDEMEKEHSEHVWLSFENVDKNHILQHFPTIYETCLKEGYDITKEKIPVVPAQHYFMGGIHVDQHSKTTMPHLYAVGETSCNGVHGKNRLASNSLLESLVFAKQAAEHITSSRKKGRKAYESDYDEADCR